MLAATVMEPADFLPYSGRDGSDRSRFRQVADDDAVRPADVVQPLDQACAPDSVTDHEHGVDATAGQFGGGSRAEHAGRPGEHR